MIYNGFRMTTSPGTLYVVATPLGNLEDVTLRAVRILKEVSLVACEDTRRTATLLRRTRDRGRRPPRTSSTTSAGKATASSPRSVPVADVALVSDAGTPGISDPGFRLVRDARAEGLPVVPLPGPMRRSRPCPSRGCRPIASFSWVPALQGRRPAARPGLARGRDRDARVLRVAAAHPAGARRPGRGLRRPRGVPVPRGDEGPRGVRPRPAVRAAGAAGAAGCGEGRDRARRSRGQRATTAATETSVEEFSRA